MEGSWISGENLTVGEEVATLGVLQGEADYRLTIDLRPYMRVPLSSGENWVVRTAISPVSA